MKKTLINPSALLLQTLDILPEHVKYERTCHSDTCSCASHEGGYNYVEVEIPEGIEVHVYSGTPRSHSRMVLLEEYEEDHRAKNIPCNAPEWAYTLNTMTCVNSIYTGEEVEVVEDNHFTVVRLLNGDWSSQGGTWKKEVKLFATFDGLNDHTKEYRDFRYHRLRTETLKKFQEDGLDYKEANRLFKIGKDRWTREMTPKFFQFMSLLRDTNPYYLALISCCISNRKQVGAAHEAGLMEVISGLSCPRTQEFAKKALWVFHGKKPGDKIKEIRATEKSKGFSMARAFDNI